MNMDIKERMKRLLGQQRLFNEQVYRLSQESESEEAQQAMSEVLQKGNDIMLILARLLRSQCGT